MKLQPSEVLFVRGGLGRFHRVTALFHDLDVANAFIATAPGEAVIAVFNDIIFLASTTDLGLPFPGANPGSRTP